MLILGIESSCDDTAVAIVQDGTIIKSSIVANQDDYHRRYGGVVPEIAARKHLEHLLPSFKYALEQASIAVNEIDAIAVTHRPGLVGSLIVGLTAAKSIALTLQKPFIGVNHLEAHAFAATYSGLKFGSDHICLVASGGHTSLLEFKAGSIRLMGRTVDDAAGEAFDKVAKVLGLGYPGGPIIDRLAKSGNPGIVQFPRPMIEKSNFNFSFSGLKTAVMYYLHQNPHVSSEDLSAAFQEAVMDVLATKTINAAKKFGHKNIAVVGGVAANSSLRSVFGNRCIDSGMNLFIPPPNLCTDNAAMVAGLAFFKIQENLQHNLELGVFADSGYEFAS